MNESPNKPQQKELSSVYQRIEDSYLLPTYLLPNYLGQTRPEVEEDEVWEQLKRKMARWRKELKEENQASFHIHTMLTSQDSYTFQFN